MILQKVKQLLQRSKYEDVNAVASVREPPAKNFKPSESSSSAKQIFYTTDDAHVWVRCHRGELSFNDKAILQNGSMFSDKHIQFAQKLI